MWILNIYLFRAFLFVKQNASLQCFMIILLCILYLNPPILCFWYNAIRNSKFLEKTVNSENVSISYVLPSLIIILFLWKRRRVYLVWFVLADIVYSPSILLIFHLEINIFLTNFIHYLYYLITQSFMTLPYMIWGTSSLLLRW